jgi:hypothetical protein
MKTVTVEEATSGLGRLVELALAGEQIQIRKGSGVVELRPAQAIQPTVNEKLSPRGALRRLQEEGRLTSVQAVEYMRELAAERQLVRAAGS